jgi:hypothetical protein
MRYAGEQPCPAARVNMAPVTTERRSGRVRACRKLAAVAVSAGLASLTLTGCLGPVGREVGVSATADGTPVVHYSGCNTGPTDITLSSSDGRILWQITSDGSNSVTSVPVGSQPAGFVTDVPYRGNPARDEQLSLGVNDVGTSWQPVFTLSDLSTDRIIDGQLNHETPEQFRDVGRRICNGTYGDPPWVRTLLLGVVIVMGLAVGYALRARFGVGLRSRRPRRSPLPNPTEPIPEQPASEA